ncbi:beta-carotene 15,15'-monooxygenase [Chryseobacterium nematophagum]|uniref:Beta-carotene 15,15'-monooxygenase n=1 Tax=Chryseobacterium nematophagum TaxID=2305228 RepID=A0A3M7LDS1_9FLAO|nr:beta-carotene 15,15'-monooxygenase [Chryseobacterium nematophagum]RMZ60687.1 beta-carotene 15,15'-monooxygenase [Chryseobacterium nematophagum]
MSEFNEFDQQGSVPEKSTGSIISHAFEMYKGVFLYAIVAMIVYLIGGFIIQSVSGFNSTAMVEEMRDSGGDYSSFSYWRAPGFSMYITLSSLLGVLLAPLYVGLIYMVNKYNTKNPIEFSDLFIGYRQNFVNILIYSIISGIISSISAFICVIPFFFVYPLFLLGYPILLFENASATEALGKSFNIAKENYWIFFGTTFLGLVISVAGIILCGIGVILTAPFIMVVMYSAYCAFLGKPRQITYDK